MAALPADCELLITGVGGPQLAQAVHRMTPRATLVAYGRAGGDAATEISAERLPEQ